MGDDRPSVYVEVGGFVYRASAIGNCIRGLVAARLGMEAQEHPQWLLDRFEEGHHSEPIMLAHFSSNEWQQYRFKMLDVDDAQSYRDMPYVKQQHDGQFMGEVPVGSSAIIRVHLDGIAQVYSSPIGGPWQNGQRVVVECKALGPNYWKKWQGDGINAFPGYVSQLTLEMEATGYPGVMVVGRKDKEGDEGDEGWGEVVEYEVVFFYHPPGSLAELKLKVMKVEKLAAGGGLPECDMKQYPCQWYWTGGKCAEGAEDKPNVIDIPEGGMNDIFQAWIKDLDKAKELEAEGKRLKEGVNWRLTQLIMEAGTGDVIPEVDVKREKSVGAVRLPDGTVVRDTVFENKGGTRVVKAYWVRYPKVEKKKERKGKKNDG